MNNALSPQHFVLHALSSLLFCAELHSFTSLIMQNWYFFTETAGQVKPAKKYILKKSEF